MSTKSYKQTRDDEHKQTKECESDSEREATNITPETERQRGRDIMSMMNSDGDSESDGDHKP